MMLQITFAAALTIVPLLTDCQPVEVIEMLLQEEEKQTLENQEPPLLPDSVLIGLQGNFEKLESHMDDEEIFRTLALTEYQKHLKANSRFMMDGAGGNWRYYIYKQSGYSLVLWSFWGTKVECRLQLPGEKHWRRKPVNAKPVEPTHLELNPQLKK